MKEKFSKESEPKFPTEYKDRTVEGMKKNPIQTAVELQRDLQEKGINITFNEDDEVSRNVGRSSYNKETGNVDVVVYAKNLSDEEALMETWHEIGGAFLTLEAAKHSGDVEKQLDALEAMFDDYKQADVDVADAMQGSSAAQYREITQTKQAMTADFFKNNRKKAKMHYINKVNNN